MTGETLYVSGGPRVSNREDPPQGRWRRKLAHLHEWAKRRPSAAMQLVVRESVGAEAMRRRAVGRQKWPPHSPGVTTPRVRPSKAEPPRSWTPFSSP